MTVGLFSRGKSKRDAADPGEGRERALEQGVDDEPDDVSDADDAPDADDVAAAESGVEPGIQSGIESVPDRSPISGDEGPFDRSKVDDDADHLNLGSIWLRGQEGMELRLEINDEEQQITGVTAVIGSSAVQLQAFAAPRTEGVWVDIRNEIAASITDAGGTAEVVTGEFGQELLTRMPQTGADGRTVFMPARFVGIDGPRWFLRAVVSGRAAIEPESAAAVHEVIRTAVIDRGDEAMPPRELLPLRLPETASVGAVAVDDLNDDLNDDLGDDLNDDLGDDLNDDLGDDLNDDLGDVDTDGSDDDGPDGRPDEVGGPGRPRVEDLKPFERGPEITEVR